MTRPAAPPVPPAERPEDPRQRLGRQGEEAASELLESKGLRIVARRFRLRLGEIDLVAEQGDLVIFVEVKTRRNTRYGAPAEAVTAVKQRRIATVALAFLSRTGRLERRVRFDVVEVFADEHGIHRVHHIEDAFRPDRDP